MREEQLAGRDHQLLVGNRDVDAGVDCGKDRLEGDRAVRRGQNDVGLALDGNAPQTRRPVVGPQRNDRRSKTPDLVAQELRVSARRQSDDLEAVAVASDDVERLRADAARRTQNGDALA